MNSVSISELKFHDVILNPVSNSSGIWFTSSDIAKALDYKSTKSITNLFNHNEDEFTTGMTQVIESVTSGNYRKKVRIFSLRGAHLIAMFARTPIAKEFRQWVLDILDKEVESGHTNPVMEKLFTLTMTEREMCSLAWLYKAATHLRDDAEKVSTVLQPLNSTFLAGMFTMSTHYKQVLADAEAVLVREIGKNINKEMNCLNWQRALETLSIH